MTEPLVKEPENQCYQATLADTKGQEEQSKTTDSGMEEESAQSPQEAGESDEEDVVPLKKNKPTHRILEDESDDDDDDSEASQDEPEDQSKTSKQKYSTPEEALDAVMNDSDEEPLDNDEGNNDDNDETKEQHSSQSSSPPSVKKKKVQRPVTDDSSDDENVTLLDTIQKKKEVEDYATPEEALEAVMRDSSDDENDGKDKDKYTSAGLFDDENSGNESEVKSSGSERSEGEADADEGFDESAVDPKLLAKLKKGAGKKPAKEKPKSRREQLTDIHSESQRMVRESQVRVPYHQPAPKSINDFLARAKSKQEQYKVVRGFRDRKVKIVEDILAKTRIKSKPKSQEELDKYSDSDEDWQPEEEGEKTLKERLDEKFNKVSGTGDNVSQDSSENTGENNDGKDYIAVRIVDSQERDMTVADSAEATETVENSEEMDTNDNVDENIDKTDVNTCKDIEDSSGKNHDCENSGNVKENKTQDRNSDEDTDNIKSDIEKQDCSQKTASLNPENTEDLTVESGSQRTQVNSSQTSSAHSKQGKDKQSLLAGMDLSDVKPCLSGQFDDFISFEEEEEAPKNPGVLKLMDRFCKHSTATERKRHKNKDISVISKDKTGIDSEELKFQTFTYHVETEEDNPLMKLETPGAKLVALKEKLKGSIKQKREQARQIRQEAYDLDNEEGAFAVEDEAEMSDRSDTDIDEDEEGEEYDEDEEEDYNEEGAEEGGLEAVDEEEMERNPFADDEADDSENDEEEDIEEDNMNLKLDVSDDEEQDDDGDDEEEEDDESQEERETVNSIKSTTDSDNKKNTPKFKEPLEKTIPDKPFSMFGGSSMQETQFESAQRSSSCPVMPIEDSQDLYGNGTFPNLLQTQGKPTQQSQSQDFTFFIEDSQSNMLDADGYLKTKYSVKKQAPQGLDDLAGTQENMSELLGLCSGRFAATQASSGRDNTSRKSLFDEVPGSTLGAGEELVGLCSGVFPDERATQVNNTGRKRKMSASSDSSIEALSDNETKQSEKDEDSEVEGGEDSDREEEEAGDTDQIDSDEEEMPKKFSGFTSKNKHGRILSEFVEQEAELSGSEFDSDENLDLAEEDDIMEVEEGDKDVKNMDQTKLRDEVGRVHFKQMIDEDKRELLRYQEMYLPDGDLYSEGGGRQRRFKWSNMDDGTQQDMFGNGSDEEVETEENENDFEWRKERYEREQFLKEQQEKEKESNENDNNQFLKFGKVFLKKQCSVDNSALRKEKSNESVKEADKTEALGSFYKLSKQKRGSFLARSKESLAKIAEKTKPIANPSAGAKSSGKFTFNVISPDKEKENMVSPAGKQRKAHVPKEKAPVTRSQKPAAKKPKLDTQNSFTENSIFNHL